MVRKAVSFALGVFVALHDGSLQEGPACRRMA